MKNFIKSPRWILWGPFLAATGFFIMMIPGFLPIGFVPWGEVAMVALGGVMLVSGFLLLGQHTVG